MKNKMKDLNNHLFAQLERLADEDLTPDDIEREAKRGSAIVAVADQVIRNAELHLKVARLRAEEGAWVEDQLPMIEGKK